MEAEPEWTTAVSYTHKGSQAWEPIYQVLNLEMFPGPRDFRVNVLDLNSRREVSTCHVISRDVVEAGRSVSCGGYPAPARLIDISMIQYKMPR